MALGVGHRLKVRNWRGENGAGTRGKGREALATSTDFKGAPNSDQDESYSNEIFKK